MIRRLMVCLLAVFTLAAASVAGLPATARAGLRLVAPEAVDVGEPFLARLESDEPLTSASLRWLGDSTPLAVFRTADGWEAVALLGAGLDDPTGDAVLQVEAAAAGGPVSLERGVAVRRHEFPEQRLDVDRKYVELSEQTLRRYRAEHARVEKVLDARERVQYLKRPFVRPVSGSVSSDFGLRRIFNGQPRKPHSGVDLRARAGTPVKAFAAGRVVLAENHYFSGNCVYLDHGQGVVSMYMHLSRIDVRAGERVAAGQVIGRVGATGRVTGPHLHFGLSVLGRPVDPLPLLQ